MGFNGERWNLWTYFNVSAWFFLTMVDLKLRRFYFVKGIKPDKCTSSAQFLVPKANPDHPNPTSPKENNQINNPIQPTQPPPTPKKRNRRTYLTKKKNLIQWRDRTNHSVILQLSNTYFFSFFFWTKLRKESLRFSDIYTVH